MIMGTLVAAAVPALADANGSTEQQTVRRSCTAPADPHYSAPAADECQKDDTGAYVAPSADGMYDATFDSNEVTCGDANREDPEANPSGIHVYGSGDATTQSGGLGLCSDGAAPVHGRIGVSGNKDDGATVTADGDNSNSTPVTDKGTGYAVVKVGPGGASVVCGPDWASGGNGSSDDPAGASQAACG
jgi:hypothetical protein